MSGTLSALSAAFSVQGLKVRLGARIMLRGIDFEMLTGQWTSVVGPNGAGKSTLLKALAGLVPFTGEVCLFGELLHNLPAKHRAQQLAWLGQNSEGAGDGFSVYDTVMLGRLPHQAWFAGANSADHAAVKLALQQTQAWDWRTRNVNALSGGERQRVLLARALAVQAKVLLMDEPLANLDPPHQADWVQVVRHLTAQGTTVVSVLHELNIALLADEVLIVRDGNLAYKGDCASDQAAHALEAVFDYRIEVSRTGQQRRVELKINH